LQVQEKPAFEIPSGEVDFSPELYTVPLMHKAQGTFVTFTVSLQLLQFVLILQPRIGIYNDANEGNTRKEEFMASAHLSQFWGLIRRRKEALQKGLYVAFY
jgi:hypothetical protein